MYEWSIKLVYKWCGLAISQAYWACSNNGPYCAKLKFGLLNEKRHDRLQAQPMRKTCSTLLFVWIGSLFFFYESVCLGTSESEAELGIAIVQINSDKKRWKTDVLPPAWHVSELVVLPRHTFVQLEQREEEETYIVKAISSHSQIMWQYWCSILCVLC